MTPPNQKSISDNEAKGTDSSNCQVLLSRKLSLQIKDELKELKKMAGVNYSFGYFLALVVENHWITEMEKARKTLEKLRRSKA